MTEFSKTPRPWYFSLNTDGENATVRILHTTVETIESVTSHRVTIDGKTRRVRCLGETCPLCAHENKADTRIYIHLWDYTDDKEKVWERTDKILPQLQTLQQSWNPLSSAVVKITRRGNEFPKYDIEVQNPMNYHDVAKELVDTKVANRYSTKRTAEEITEFINTGKFPERREYLSKEDYKKQKEAEAAGVTNTQVNSVGQPVSVNQTAVSNGQTFESTPIANTAMINSDCTNMTQPDYTDPFMDDFITKPRKI